MENNNVNVGFFNLTEEGQTANVKLLYSSCSKLTILKTHSIPNGINPNNGNPAKKRVKCLGENCPVCKDGRYPVEDRLYLHLYDFADNTEKVWDRTANAKFLESLADIENNWGDLKTPKMSIKRDSKDFPTYTVSAFPDKDNVNISADRYDIDVSYRCGIYRSAEELTQALATGVVPAHTKKVVDTANNQTATVAKVDFSHSTSNYATNRVEKLVEPTMQVQTQPVVEPSYNDDDLPF